MYLVLHREEYSTLSSLVLLLIIFSNIKIEYQKSEQIKKNMIACATDLLIVVNKFKKIIKLKEQLEKYGFKANFNKFQYLYKSEICDFNDEVKFILAI